MIQRVSSGEAITASKILAVEGYDEADLCQAFFKELNIQNVAVRNLGGESKISTELRLIARDSNFSRVTHLGIMLDGKTDSDADAETNQQRRFQSAADILKSQKLNYPDTINAFSANESQSGKPKVGIFITSEMIERLFLDSVATTPDFACVEKFIERLNQKPKELLKAQTQAYLSVQPKLVHRIGLAARNGAVNFNDNAFAELKKLLQEFQS